MYIGLIEIIYAIVFLMAIVTLAGLAFMMYHDLKEARREKRIFDQGMWRYNDPSEVYDWKKDKHSGLS